jgi:protein TilB
VLKRAEHNDGMLSTLEEITLHQQNIEKIEVLGYACRNLKMLYLQNNLIAKIENLHRLKVTQVVYSAGC